MSNNYSAPDVIVQWQKDMPPFVEIRHGGQLLVTGYVFPTPDGPLTAIGLEPNPVIPVGSVGPVGPTVSNPPWVYEDAERRRTR